MELEIRESAIQGMEVSDPLNQRHDALPPTDEGLQAWLLLSGCFMINVLIWGFAFSFGVLQEYYMSHEPFASAAGGVPAIGTTATGLMYLLMPAYFFILQRWPHLKVYSAWASLPLLAGALVGASFANTVGQLIICQGILFALGGNMLFAPTVTYLDEWFVRRKGLAVGIMWAGDGAGGVIMPLVLNALLTRYGFRITLRAVACVMIVIMAPLVAFLKPRVPIAATSTTRPVDISFLKSSLFWILQVFNIVQGTGHFLPPNFLPSYANHLGLGPQTGSILLVTTNATSVIGCILVGLLIDRLDVTTVVLTISIGASAAVLAVWGVSASVAPLLVFSLLYGLTAGSYSTSWTGMIKDIKARHTTADTNVAFGFLAAGRGIGSVISGPLSGALMNVTYNAIGKQMLAYGSSYRFLILFSGCTALVGGSSWLVRKAGFI